jgi:hypothetical protein
MPEEKKIIAFSSKEIAERLIREQGITSGHWGLFVRFGLGATNVGDPSIPNVLFPAAVVTLMELGIQEFPEANPLTVDASTLREAKPAKKTAKK